MSPKCADHVGLESGRTPSLDALRTWDTRDYTKALMGLDSSANVGVVLCTETRHSQRIGANCLCVSVDLC